jgi:hypothetical protein
MKEAKIGEFLLFFVLMFSIFSEALHAGTMVVGGSMIFRFAVLSDDAALLNEFPQYENESNSQQVVARAAGRIVVENRADLTPFTSDVPFPLGDRYRTREDLTPWLEYATRRSGVRITVVNGQRSERPIEEVNPVSEANMRWMAARALAAASGAERQDQAVEQVLLSVRTSVSYLLNASEDPAQVLRSGRADCDGYSNAAAILLRSLGIPVKVVDSYIPPGHMWGYGPEGSGGYHAHIEVYYEDAGWVSYDVQATLHFVDPFHVVGYPRSGLRIEERAVEDKRSIVGMEAGPAGEIHMFRRKVFGELSAPLFVGTLRDEAGALLRDSPRSDRWIFLRNDRGEGNGLLILPSGEFALSSDTLGSDASGQIFYPGRDGGYFEQNIDLSGLERGAVLRRNFDIGRDQGTVISTPKGARELYRWHLLAGGGWNLEPVSLGADGSVKIVSNQKQWIISFSRNQADPRYLVDLSHAVPPDPLPVYLEPGKAYLKLQPSLADVPLVLFDASGRRYAPEITAKQGEASLPLLIPDKGFDRVLLYRDGEEKLFFGSLGEGEDRGGALLYTIASTRFDLSLSVAVKRPGSPLLLLEREGRRWRQLLKIARPGASLTIAYPSEDAELLRNLALLPAGASVPEPLPSS